MAQEGHGDLERDQALLPGLLHSGRCSLPCGRGVRDCLLQRLRSEDTDPSADGDFAAAKQRACCLDVR